MANESGRRTGVTGKKRFVGTMLSKEDHRRFRDRLLQDEMTATDALGELVRLYVNGNVILTKNAGNAKA